MIYLVYRGFYYYFEENLDAVVLIFGIKVSMRDQIVSRCFDLAFWFCYQAYQLCKYPTHFQAGGDRIKWENKRPDSNAN